MAVRNHFHNAKAGVESPVTKKLSGIRLLFADLKFMRRTHYIMQFYRIHLCVLLTKQDFHFTNMHLAYKTGFSFYKYASRLQSVAFRFTNGTLGLQFIDFFGSVRTDFLFFVLSVRILQNFPLFSASRKLIFSDLYVLISCFSCFPYVFCRNPPFF